MPSKARVTLYYDVVSPYARLAYKVLKRYESVWHIELVLAPRHLRTILDAAGNQPPGMLPSKALYLFGQDLPLTSAYFDVPFSMPKPFPFPSVHAMRFLHALAAAHDQATLAGVTEAIWDGLHAHGGAIVNFASMIPAESLCPAEVAALLIRAESEENQAATKAAAEALAAEGAFGVPWIVAGLEDGRTHAFFGSDRLELLAHFLGEKWEGPCPSGAAKA